MKSIDKAVELSAPTRNVFKRNLTRLAATLLVALANFVTAPNAALAGAPQHHDQAPGFYRLAVGDLEVTALYDGTGVFDQQWLNGTKATMEGVVKALHEDPHMLDVVDLGFLVHTGKQLILVDAGAGTWWGGGSTRAVGGQPPQCRLHAGRSRPRFGHAPPFRSRRRPSRRRTESASFPMPMFTSRRLKATFGCHRKLLLRRQRMRNRSSRVRKP